MSFELVPNLTLTDTPTISDSTDLVHNVPGGSPSGGGGGRTEAPTIKELSIHLKPDAISMGLGDTKEGTFSIEWNTKNTIQINRIRILNDIDSLSLTFQDLPNPIILSAEDDGSTIRDVKFTVSAPNNECTQVITTNCVQKIRYNVIVEVQFFHLNALFLETITIPIDLSGIPPLDFSFLTIAGAGGLVAFMIYKGVKSKSRKRQHSKKSKKKTRVHSKIKK